ncbi:tRNA A64-2'-O-ribosylphosphate transferase [Scleroderma yunnanense]
MASRDSAAIVLAELRKESQDIYNRIHSIAEDAEFVKQVHQYYPNLPLLPNMRCGAWYTDPDIASSECAYFKSTDGHTNNWSFNLRRPNLHILPLIVQHHGLILVDSTRAGKRIPDALSKTVPIWCSVINRAFLRRPQSPNFDTWDTTLYTPPAVVSAQEHNQIEQKLDAWAAELAASFYKLPELQLPLRPIWITPATTTFPSLSAPTLPFYPIVCLSASKLVADGLERRANGFAYIQGSGDDHELWSMDLTPTVFWKNCDVLLQGTRSALPGLVLSLLPGSDLPRRVANDTLPTPVTHVSGLLSISSTCTLQSALPFVASSELAVVWLTSSDPSCLLNANTIDPSRLLCIQTPEGKKGQHHFLRTVLPRSMPFIEAQLLRGNKVCIACDTGKDTSVGLCVAVLTKHFHEDGSFNPQKIVLSKTILKTRLQWIISSYPTANPSRTTLKRVNDFLLSPPQCTGSESLSKNQKFTE